LRPERCSASRRSARIVIPNHEQHDGWFEEGFDTVVDLMEARALLDGLA